MKVCHMTSAHDSDDVRIFQKECVSLAKSGHEVYLVARGQSRNEKNVTVIGVGDAPSGRLKRMFFFSKQIYREALKIDADVYHFHDPELLRAGLKLKKKGKHVIFDSHENTSEQIKIKKYLPKAARNMASIIYKSIETYICKKIDAVIFPCTVDGKNPFAGRCRKTVFINNYPFLSEFSDAEQQNECYDVCVIGSLTCERGITYLLEAVNLIGAKVALAGRFSPDEYRDSLEDAGLMDNVDFFGECSRKEVVDLYGKSKMTVSNILPVGQYSFADNLPTKVYECMAMKKPVVISAMNYPLRLLDEYKFGIPVKPDNPEEISAAIKTLILDENLRRKMGSEGYRAVENEFSWEKESDKLISLYSEMQ